MKLLRNGVLLFTALLTLLYGAAQFGRFDYSHPRASVRAIYTLDNPDSAVGTGVMIAPMLMLTAGHAASLEGLTVGDQRAPLKFLRVDKERDLALALVAEGCPCAWLGVGEPEVDDTVVTIGYPLNKPYKLQVLTEGRVQGYRGEHFMGITSPVAPGGSGGGTFAWDGVKWTLVGIVSSMACQPRMGCFGHLASVVRLGSVTEFLSTRSPAELAALKPQDIMADPH